MTTQEIREYLTSRAPAEMAAGFRELDDYEFDQLWAEAVHRFKRGESVPFFGDALKEMGLKRDENLPEAKAWKDDRA